jgi:hypothetical protein
MLGYSWNEIPDLKRLSNILQWVAIGLVFLGGSVALLRFVVDQREKALSSQARREKDDAQLKREKELREALEQSKAEVDQVKNRNVFRPIPLQLRQELIAYLRQIGVQAANAPPKLSINIESGSRNRVLVGDQIVEIFREAGLQAEIAGVRQTYSQGAIPVLNMRIASATEGLANAVIKALGAFMKVEYRGYRVETVPVGSIELDINGEPEFEPDGTFTLK